MQMTCVLKALIENLARQSVSTITINSGKNTQGGGISFSLKYSTSKPSELE